MNSRQRHIPRGLSSVYVGGMAFLITVPAVLLGPRGEGLLPPPVLTLLLISGLAALIIGGLAGRRYYRRLAARGI